MYEVYLLLKSCALYRFTSWLFEIYIERVSGREGTDRGVRNGLGGRTRRDATRQTATSRDAEIHYPLRVVSPRASDHIITAHRAHFASMAFPISFPTDSVFRKVIDHYFRLPSNTIVRATSIFPIPFHFRSVFDHDISTTRDKKPWERDRSISLLRIWSRKRFSPRVNATSIYTRANYRRLINVLRVRKTSLRAPVSNQPKARL